jgi:hypothetical protein
MAVVIVLYGAWIAVIIVALIISMFAAKTLVSGYEPYDDTE